MGEVVLVDLVSVSVDVNGRYYIEEKGRSSQGEMEAPSPSIELDHSQGRHAVEDKEKGNVIAYCTTSQSCQLITVCKYLPSQ